MRRYKLRIEQGILLRLPVVPVGAKPKRRFLRRSLRSGIAVSEKGTVETRVEALVENLAVALMQADNLAADSPEYGVLAETLAYALHQIPRPRVATTR